MKEKTLSWILFILFVMNLGILLLPNTEKNFEPQHLKKVSLSVVEKEQKFQVGSKHVNSIIEATIDDENNQDKVLKLTTGLNQIGKNYIAYQFVVNDFYIEEQYNEIEVVDEVAPNIFLRGHRTVLLPLGSTYVEEGYHAVDAYEGDLTGNVEVKGNVNTNQIGEYYITYQVQDSSGNASSVQRKVIVKQTVEDEKEEEDVFDEKQYDHTVMDSLFHNKGMTFIIYTNADKGEVKINDQKVELMKDKDNYYRLILDLSDYENGEYEIFFNGKSLKDERKMIDRIARTKMNDKLVTMNYKDNKVSFQIEDFEYEYDVLIDAGHGGKDSGSIYKGIIERDMNLEQTLYEKKRYEDHGLKVKLIRDDDSYGQMLGEDDWKLISKRAYTTGYYSVVSKIAYSNHHNYSANKKYSGFEVLVPGSLTLEELREEYEIFNSWGKIYPLTDDHIRFYGRNYETTSIANKANGDIYTFTDYYAVNRVCLNLFHEKVPIYEGSYMSNDADYSWYFKDQNWKQMSEAKIKVYVESLGLTYKGVL